MKYFNFPIKELSGSRLPRLTSILGISTAEGIGLLTLYWLHTRQALMEQGRLDDFMSYLPGLLKTENERVIINAMVTAGYLQPLNDGNYLIVDNKGHPQRAQRIVTQCKKAAAARIAKSAAPAPTAKPARRKAAVALVTTPAQEANSQTWEAYCQAYTARMGQPPLRNAKANSLIKQFVERIGHEDAPHVIVFFVQHPNKHYMARLYQLEMAVHDAESLRTQWARGAAVTQGDFVHMDEQHAIDRERLRITHGH